MASLASPRWRKLRGDLRAMRGRMVAMVLALSISLIGVGTVLGARTVLRREIAASYLGTRPADATLELVDDVDAAMLAAVRARPEVAAAEARDSVIARVHDGAAGGAASPWQPLQLFVIDDFAALQLNTFRRESGALAAAGGHDAARAHRRRAARRRRGQHDDRQDAARRAAPGRRSRASCTTPASRPAWQERKGYGYITRDTLAALGEPPALHELRVGFRPAPGDARRGRGRRRRAGELARHGRSHGPPDPRSDAAPASRTSRRWTPRRSRCWCSARCCSC